VHVAGRRLAGSLQSCSFLPIGFFVNLQCALLASSTGGDEVQLYRNAALLSLEGGRLVIAVRFDAQHGSVDAVAWTAHSGLTASLAPALHRVVMKPAAELLQKQYQGLDVSLAALCPHCLAADRSLPCPFTLVGPNAAEAEIDTAFLQQSRSRCHLDVNAGLSPALLLHGAVLASVPMQHTEQGKEGGKEGKEGKESVEDQRPPGAPSRPFVYVCVQPPELDPELQLLWLGLKGIAGQAMGARIRVVGLGEDDVRDHKLSWAWKCHAVLVILTPGMLKVPGHRLALLRRLRCTRATRVQRAV
jgi:hypothetical protein